MGNAAPRIARTGFLALLALGVYLGLAGSVSGTETIAGAPIAVAVAAFVWRQSRLGRPIFPNLPPGRALAAALASLVSDTLRVGAVLTRAVVARPRGGDSSWQAFNPGGADPSDAGRRALATILTSMAPNGFVLDFAPPASTDRGLLLHRLAPAPPLSGRDWPS